MTLFLFRLLSVITSSMRIIIIRFTSIFESISLAQTMDTTHPTESILPTTMCHHCIHLVLSVHCQYVNTHYSTNNAIYFDGFGATIIDTNARCLRKEHSASDELKNASYIASLIKSFKTKYPELQ
eukprot:164270_1